MGKKAATNTFSKGLNTDTHPLSTPNDVLTDALNATFITLSGDELTLLNDFGNIQLPNSIQGKTILGIKEFGGILYIASVKTNTINFELGTYPSPDYLTGNIVNEYKPLMNLKYSENGVPGEFITSYLNFDINHPVDIEILKSYDGSVNLILNDDKNIPRLINSGFAVIENNKYEIPKHNQSPTNIYNAESQSTFDIQTSLNKRILKIPKIEYIGVIDSGELKVGNYTFYFQYCDADNNETDIIEQSGLVSIFKGTDADPFTIDGGFRDENANKSVRFKISDFDLAYPYIKVSYSRDTSDLNQNRVTIYKKIDHKYSLEEDGYLTITGAYNEIDLTSSSINTPYVILEHTKTLTLASSILFLANVEQRNSDVDELKSMSLQISPYYTAVESRERIGYIDPTSYLDTSNLTETGRKFKGEYYNTKNIYYNVGYWSGELYRVGIVYVFEDGSLSPVYNIKGYLPLSNSPTNYGDYNDKGVFYIPLDNSVINPLYFLNVKFPDNFKKTLQKYKVLGLFLVRLKRMPLRLCQSYVIPNDPNSKLPTIFRKRLNALCQENPQGETGYTLKKISGDHSDHESAAINLGWMWKSYQYNLVGESFIFDPNNTSYFYFKKGQENQTELKLTAKQTNSLIINLNIEPEKWQEVIDYEGRLFYFPPGKADLKKKNEIINKLKTEYNQHGYSGGREVYTEYLKTLNHYSGLCPEFYIKQPHFNLFFTGGKFHVEYSEVLPGTDDTYTYLELHIDNPRHYYAKDEHKRNILHSIKDAYITSVTDSLVIGSANREIFKGKAGDSLMAYNTSFYYLTPYKINNAYDVFDNSEDFDTGRTPNAIAGSDEFYNTLPLVRGLYSPYLGITLESVNDTPVVGKLIDIFIPNYDSNKLKTDYKIIREEDSSPYYPITERFRLQDFEDKLEDIARGDCFLCTYTQRLNRNFLDSEVPTSDSIVDNYTWRHYELNNGIETELLNKINRADVNAVPLGSWVTFKFRASCNMSIRSNDGSYVAEKAMVGKDRSYFPKDSSGTAALSKIPESQVFNDGFGSTMGQKVYFTLPDAPYYNYKFNNRVYYSEIAGETLFQNNYRVIKSTNYRDYNKEFGSITKILEVNNNLLIVFEHGIGLALVNERQLITDTSDNGVYIHSNKVLPDQLVILSDTFGSTWKDSVIKTPYYIYGYDSVEKKIWRTSGREAITVISDLKVERFLLENTFLKETDTIVTLGEQNIKTHYNANKSDVMFTYYDSNTKWNLCYNELLKQFTTFYSWLPIHSGNIDNTFISTTLDSMWVHGYNNKFEQKVLPTNWYGELHPFEFEFVVREVPAHKIFNNLLLISNAAEPESFHFEITGDVYDFEKPTIYYRLEQLRHLYSLNGSNIKYDKDYTNINVSHSEKSTLFPLYYYKENPKLLIHSVYTSLECPSKNYVNLSGTEVVWDKRDNEYNLYTHIKNSPIDKVGRLRGNSHYKEDKWDVQIPSITYMQKNEEPWIIPPIVLTAPYPEDLETEYFVLPNTFLGRIDLDWTNRKETKIRDKYCKIRVRYSGTLLAIISAIQTIYTESYA